MTRPRVLIADDHPATRAGVRDALERGDCEVCTEASTAADAVRLALDQRPDVCLLNISMPGNGLSAVREIAKHLPDCRIIMFTISDSATDLYDALQFGAVGYLLKGDTSVDIATAVHTALAGQTVLSGQLTEKVLDEFRRGHARLREITDTEGHPVTLTPREIEVLDLLTDGLSTAEIAARLSIRPITVRRHISDAMRKLRVRTRAEALAQLRSHEHHRL